MEDFKIEKGVPIPPPTSGVGVTSKFPFGRMEVGDSVWFPGPLTEKQKTQLVGSWGRITKLKGYRFVSRRSPEGMRIWRVS